MVMGSGALMFVLVQATKLSLGSIVVIGGCAVALLATLLVHEFRIREPMLPLALWRDPIVVGGNLANLFIGAILMGVTAFLPAYVQGVMGKGALTAGFMLTAMSASWPTGSAVAGQIMQRTSYRTCALAGTAFVVSGTAMMLAIAPTRGTLFVALAALLTGFGMGLVNNSFLVAVQSNVAAEDRGVATSSVVFMRMVGQSLGTAIFGGIVNAALAGRVAGRRRHRRPHSPARLPPVAAAGPARAASARNGLGALQRFRHQRGAGRGVHRDGLPAAGGPEPDSASTQALVNSATSNICWVRSRDFPVRRIKPLSPH